MLFAERDWNLSDVRKLYFEEFLFRKNQEFNDINARTCYKVILSNKEPTRNIYKLCIELRILSTHRVIG